jgi:hypothetical protein
MTDDVTRGNDFLDGEKLSCPAGMRRWNDGEAEFSCSGAAVYEADRDRMDRVRIWDPVRPRGPNSSVKSLQ